MSFFLKLRVFPVRTAARAFSKPMRPQAWRAPLLVKNYRTFAARGRYIQPSKQVSPNEVKDEGKAQTIPLGKISAHLHKKLYSEKPQGCDLHRVLVAGAVLYPRKKLVHVTLHHLLFANWDVWGKRNTGGLSDEEFIHRVGKQEPVPREACSLYRVSLCLEKYYKLKRKDGQSIQVYSIKFGKTHQLEVKAVGRSHAFAGSFAPYKPASMVIHLETEPEQLAQGVEGLHL